MSIPNEKISIHFETINGQRHFSLSPVTWFVNNYGFYRHRMTQLTVIAIRMQFMNAIYEYDIWIRELNMPQFFYLNPSHSEMVQ